MQQVTGNQPDGGKMSHQILKLHHLAGYEQFGIIKITYNIPNGTQGPNHPNPRQKFIGDTFYAYLPDSPEGNYVLDLLRKAFKAKMIFTIGTSTTTGKADKVVWSDIHHKTSIYGGSERYIVYFFHFVFINPHRNGYPDGTYLKRVKEKLHQKGIA